MKLKATCPKCRKECCIEFDNGDKTFDDIYYANVQFTFTCTCKRSYTDFIPYSFTASPRDVVEVKEK